MSNTKHEVTVYDRVPATAAVSVAQVERYLTRTGWRMRRELLDRWSEWWSAGEEHTLDLPPRDDLAEWRDSARNCIERLAEHEKRQPSAVLADIAREPES